MRMHEETATEHPPVTHSAPPNGTATQDTLGQAAHADQARVTPKELTDAVARIEARRDDGRRLQEATIPIGEALQQLGLDATPEEVLAEVRAGRVRQQQRPAERRGLALIIAACTGGLGLAAVLGAVALHGVVRPAPAVIAVSPATETAAPAPAPSAASAPVTLGPSLQVRDESDQLVLLSEVKDGQMVRALLSEDGTSLVDYVPYARSSRESWGLVKYKDQVYLRGYSVPVSPRLLRAKGTLISSEPYDDSRRFHSPDHTAAG